MELATALIWTLRIVLPIILFWIYFKLQSPKDESAQESTENRYGRSELLEHRKAALAGGSPVPEALENLALVDESRAPALFAAQGRQPRGGGRKPRDGGGAGGEVVTRDRRDRGDRGERAEKRIPKETARVPLLAAEDGPTVPTEAPATAADPVKVDDESDKMHLESLLNYVAFNRKEQQRTFLIDEEGGAPPPPPPKKKAAGAAPVAPSSPLVAPAPPPMKMDNITISTTTAGKANAEAQMVLRGAIDFKRSGVAKDLYEQLVESEVEISEQTFTLMIEACILAKDLKYASDFLMKMEAKGFSPDMELLDKVMDLYSLQKVQREQEKQSGGRAMVQPSEAEEFGLGMGGMGGMGGMWTQDGMILGMAMPESAEGSLEAVRPKLSSAAAMYVPFSGADQEDSTSAPPLPPSDSEGGPSSKTPLLLPQRTALSARAKPFQSVQDVVFDPNTYTWTVSSQQEEAGGKGDGKKGEGVQEKKQKGKKGKETGDAKAEDQEVAPENKPSKKEKKEWKAKAAA